MVISVGGIRMKLILSHEKFYANSESSTLLVKTAATD